MGSEIPPLPVDRGEQTAEQPESQPAAALDTNRDVLFSQPADKEDRSLHWIFFGEEGLRAGWSLAIFLCLIYGMGRGLKFALAWWHVTLPHGSNPISPETAFVGELIQLLVLLAAAWIVSRIERRKELDYNLR